MYAQHIHSRHTILSACLRRELDGFYVDAYANLRSRVSELGSPRCKPTIHLFLDSYRYWAKNSDSYSDALSLSPGRVRWMAAYHTQVARPLALDNVEAVPDGIVLRDVIGLKFFGLFDPWEAEAVGCFNTFVRQQYERIFTDVHANLHYDNIRFIGPNVSVDNYRYAFNLEPGPSRRMFMEDMISRSLKTLVRALESDNNEELACFIAHFLETGPTVALTLSEAMRVGGNLERRSYYPSVKDAAESRRDSMLFLGDSSPPTGPPLSWVRLWEEEYINVYGSIIPESLRLWGHVMWDAARWSNMGMEKLIHQQWLPGSLRVACLEEYWG
ncbi:hypothetical protein F4777DRAFT_598078 [Nemania sp. FL0916]|nr:hypothetical protein F4777DRAFT_598078 [Nemania sp. FL0916]